MTEVHLFDPRALYRHWEDAQWSPFAVDLSADEGQWRDLGEEDRGLVFWVLSSLMVAEERKEIRDFAVGGLTRRLRVIGVPLSTL